MILIFSMNMHILSKKINSILKITRTWNVVYISRKANQNYVNTIDAVCEKFAPNIISIQQVRVYLQKLWANTAF